MVLKRKKRWVLLILLALLFFPLAKSLPIMRERECHRAFFPKDHFQSRLQKPPSPWMLTQLASDLAPFKLHPITTDSINKTHEAILSKMGHDYEITHFRILDNKLYKYIPDGAPFSDTDTLMEKGLKTLLLYSTVPNCDFILCAMDGVPEHYVPEDFYLADDPETQAPILAQAKRASLVPRYIVLIPDQLSLSKEWHQAAQEILSTHIPWEEKKPIAIWRGGLSDTGVPTDGRLAPNYAATPRFALARLASLNPTLLDAGFAGLDSPIMAEIAESLGFLKKSISRAEHLKAKYLPVLDGHMCTYPGYQWRLLSNSVCLKQESDQVQWFYRALVPFQHFIPIKNDMSDLLDKIAWAKEHDAEAKQIAKRAQQFAREELLLEDAYYYLHLAFDTYAQYQEIDFDRLKTETKQDTHWKCIHYRKRLALMKSINKTEKITRWTR